MEETILEGERYQDDLRRYRAVFDRDTIVMRRSQKPPPTGPGVGAFGLHLLELCVGDRTLAEIVLRAHASEYEVLKTLYEFYQDGHIEIPGGVPPVQDPSPLLDDDGTPFLGDRQQPHGNPAEDERSAVSAGNADGEETLEVQLADPYALVRIVSEKFDSGDEEGAIAVLDSCYRTRHHDDFLKQLLDKAEEAYLSKIRGEFLQLDRVPVRSCLPETLSSTELSATESALLGLIDGRTNIQSILWIVPLHEIQILRGLERLRTRGLIRLEHAPVGEKESSDVEEPLPSA